MKKWPYAIQQFLKDNEAKIALFVGLLLVSSLSFEAGLLSGQKWQEKPLIIEKQVDVPKSGETPGKGLSETSETVSEPKSESVQNAKCPYVGSKNSTKFYLSTCSWAKQIKPENVVCFSSPQEAISQGRTESKCAK